VATEGETERRDEQHAEQEASVFAVTLTACSGVSRPS